jgi:metallo-beta-lactamase family protein
MQMTFCGAAGEVTGSCTLVEAAQARVLIDFGMFQGSRDDDEKNMRDPGFEPSKLDAVIVTHAHIDHTGRLPLLIKNGYRGKIFATPETCELLGVMLKDSAHLQEDDARRQTVKNERVGKPPVEPLYREEDVAPVLERLQPVELNREIKVARDCAARFSDAGHIIGSASVLLRVGQGDSRRTAIFSGDLGATGVPLMNDPVAPTLDGEKVDVIVLESTYGDRDHRSFPDTYAEYAGIMHEAIWEKRKVLMPAFAIGRTQALLYCANKLIRGGRVAQFPIFLDSPMGTTATKIYEKYESRLDAEVRRLIAAGEDPLGLRFVTCVETGEDSRTLNDRRGPMMVIAASGMCTGGRIVHHLRHNLWKRETSVVIAGYQSQGSLGRRLVDGADEVRIMGDTIPVRARIHTVGGFSAHAGRSGLLQWVKTYTRARKPGSTILLNHGEAKQRTMLAEALKAEGWNVTLPEFLDRCVVA